MLAAWAVPLPRAKAVPADVPDILLAALPSVMAFDWAVVSVKTVVPILLPLAPAPPFSMKVPSALPVPLKPAVVVLPPPA